MRCLLLALVLVGCSSSPANPGTTTPQGGAGGVGGAEAGRGGEANSTGQPGAGQGGGGAASGEAGEGGALITPGSSGGAAGAPIDAEAGASGAAGETGAPPDPGSLFASCDAMPVFCQADWTCGPWAPVEGQPVAHLCSFGCWSLQTLGGSHTPAMAPDAALTAKCTGLGGVCNASGGGYPVCAPY